MAKDKVINLKEEDKLLNSLARVLILIAEETIEENLNEIKHEKELPKK